MAQINKPNQHFNTKLYTGNGSTNNISGVGFQPDFTWIKQSDGTYGHDLYDAVRGATKVINTNNLLAEYTDTARLTSFNSDGFSLGNEAPTNGNGNNFTSWNWLAGNSTSSNSDGSITSTVSANTTAGFSIVSYTGTGSAATVGHGLGAKPQFMIHKNRSTSNYQWGVYHKDLGEDSNINFTTSTKNDSTTYYNNTAPTTSVFSIGTNVGYNENGSSFIAYCWAEKKGFSKFGKFTSTGSDNGAYIYTGFSPAFVLIKPIVTDAWANWYLFDNKRDTYNVADLPQYPNTNIQDGYYGGTPATNYSQIDMLSTGFKIRRDGNWGVGGSGQESIYIAFAANPLVGTNEAVATAR